MNNRLAVRLRNLGKASGDAARVDSDLPCRKNFAFSNLPAVPGFVDEDPI
jgi:hypothetical protein